METTVKAIEDAFKEFTSREDIAIVLISQYVAKVDSYNKAVPAILDKDHPYDPAHDSTLSSEVPVFCIIRKAIENPIIKRPLFSVTRNICGISFKLVE